jgi:hypothetical protein
MPATFQNQPPIDFARREHRAAMQEALAAVGRRLGRHCPLVIGGREVETPEQGVSTDPAQKDRVVGTFALAEREHVAGGRRGQGSLERLGRLAGRAAGRVFAAGGRRDARAAVRTGRVGSL